MEQHAPERGPRYYAALALLFVGVFVLVTLALFGAIDDALRALVPLAGALLLTATVVAVARKWRQQPLSEREPGKERRLREELQQVLAERNRLSTMVGEQAGILAEHEATILHRGETIEAQAAELRRQGNVIARIMSLLIDEMEEGEAPEAVVGRVLAERGEAREELRQVARVLRADVQFEGEDPHAALERIVEEVRDLRNQGVALTHERDSWQRDAERYAKERDDARRDARQFVDVHHEQINALWRALDPDHRSGDWGTTKEVIHQVLHRLAQPAPAPIAPAPQLVALAWPDVDELLAGVSKGQERLPKSWLKRIPEHLRARGYVVGRLAEPTEPTEPTEVAEADPPPSPPTEPDGERTAAAEFNIISVPAAAESVRAVVPVGQGRGHARGARRGTSTLRHRKRRGAGQRRRAG